MPSLALSWSAVRSGEASCRFRGFNICALLLSPFSVLAHRANVLPHRIADMPRSAIPASNFELLLHA